MLRCGILAVLAIAVAGGVLSPLIGRANATKPARPVFDSDVLTEQVAFHEARVSRDPTGAIGYHMLANAYLNRARETQTHADATRAEAAARKSLQIRKRGNAVAFWRLGQSLMQQHRFRDALAAANDGLAVQPGFGSCVRLSADALIELGELDEATKVVRDNPTEFSDTPVGLSIRARLLEAMGNSEGALATMQSAVHAVESDVMMSPETSAWYLTKFGQMLSANGQQQAADEHFNRALAGYPRDWKARIGRARVALIQGRSRDAIAHLGEAGKIVELMEVPALLVEAYADLGDSQGVQAAWDRLRSLHYKEHREMKGEHGHTHDRQYAEIQLNWNRDFADALAMAKHEYQHRQDAMTRDLLAWANFKSGKLEVAQKLLKKNERIGKLSASRLFHQGVISSRSGDRDGAAKDLSRALELGLLPSERAEAERELKSIKGGKV